MFFIGSHFFGVKNFLIIFLCKKLKVQLEDKLINHTTYKPFFLLMPSRVLVKHKDLILEVFEKSELIPSERKNKNGKNIKKIGFQKNGQE